MSSLRPDSEETSPTLWKVLHHKGNESDQWLQVCISSDSAKATRKYQHLYNFLDQGGLRMLRGNTLISSCWIPVGTPILARHMKNASPHLIT